jgi:hypothetical protein
MDGNLPFEVGRALVINEGSTARNMVLTFPTPDLAVFERSSAARNLCYVFFLAGFLDWVGAGIVWYVTGRMKLPDPKGALIVHIGVPVLMIVFSIVPIIIGWLSLSGKIGPKKIFFDRRESMIIKDARKVEPVFQGGIRFSYVAAIQICSGIVRDSHSHREFKTFELNLVLSSPPGPRARLISHAKEKDLRDDARQLAQFLKVPLLDHTQS